MGSDLNFFNDVNLNDMCNCSDQSRAVSRGGRSNVRSRVNFRVLIEYELGSNIFFYEMFSKREVEPTAEGEWSKAEKAGRAALKEAQDVVVEIKEAMEVLDQTFHDLRYDELVRSFYETEHRMRIEIDLIPLLGHSSAKTDAVWTQMSEYCAWLKICKEDFEYLKRVRCQKQGCAS